MKQTRFLKPAAAEIEEHVNYFDRQLSGLGDRFEQEVRYAVTIISEYPEIGSPLTGESGSYISARSLTT